MDFSLVFELCLICSVYGVIQGQDDVGVIRELWSDVSGNSIQNLLADSRFPHRPSTVNFVKDFDAPLSLSKSSMNNAQRIKGYFLAPQTGEYKFYSSCSGSCEVFLGLNGMEGENNRIITQHHSTKHNEFEKFPEQVSHSISLEQDKRYYLEAINKQTDADDDNLSVGVELPDGKRMFPILGQLLRKSKFNNNAGLPTVHSLQSSISNRLPKTPNKNVIIPKVAAQEQHSTGVNRALHQLDENRNVDTPVVDLEGNKYEVKDAIEPGINIFSEAIVDSKTSHRERSTEAPSGEGETSKDEDNSNLEFQFDDVPPKQNVESDNQSDKYNGRIIEASFGKENKTFADMLKQHLKMSDLISPGGKIVSLTGKQKNRVNSLKTNNRLSNSNDNTDFVAASNSNSLEAGDAVQLDVKDTSNINKTFSDSVTKKIQKVEFASKKTKTARVIGRIMNLIGHNRPYKNQTKLTGNTRSFYGEGYGGGMSLGHGGYGDGHGAGHFGLPMDIHGSMDTHGAMPEGHMHHVEALHNTGAVAMVPALLHHDRPHYDHESGELHEGGTHIEPLIPVQNGGQIIEGPRHSEHERAGHGGGMEHAMGMMHPYGAVDMDYGMSHHIPEIHGHHDDYHHEHHIEPLPVMPMAPVAPAPAPVHHKPDIIKVEFVPEEITVEATNKSKIESPSNKKAGTVRVQFIPGDMQDASTTDAVARHKSPSVSSEPSSKVEEDKSGSTITISAKKGQNNVALNALKMSMAGKNEDKHPIENGNKVIYNPASSDIKEPVHSQVKSHNGYELNPKLPAQVSSHDSVVTTMINNAGGFSSGVGGGGSNRGLPMTSYGGGGGGGGGGQLEEHIDPALTTLGQQYSDALQSEQKAAINAERKPMNGDDRVYFGGGAAVSQPDPNPTRNAPSEPIDPNEPHGPSINPVANHLVEAMNVKAVSAEEALQMMNDFVSGNQDMGKAARNMEGMLGQIAMNRRKIETVHHVESESSNDRTLNGVGNFPDSSSVQGPPDETQPRFIDNSNDLGSNYNSGYTDPTFQKEIPSESHFSNAPSPELFNENGAHSAPTFDFPGNQRDEASPVPPSLQNQMQQQDLNMMINNREDLSKVNQMSPNGPLPPVHIFDSAKNSFQQESHSNPPQSLVMEPVKSSYDGFANPQFHKSTPSLPMNAPVDSILDKIDPHEGQNIQSSMNPGETNFFAGGADNTVVQPPEGLSDPPANRMMTEMPRHNPGNVQDVNQSPQVTMNTHQTLMNSPEENMNFRDEGANTGPMSNSQGSNHFQDDSNQISQEEINNMEPFGRSDSSEAELPQGQIVPSFPVGETSMGYADENQNNAARKFNTPHSNSLNLQRSKLKEQTGKRKHDVLADMYADAIFPEDASDIESLKGSLQGKTLTYFDKTEQLEHTEQSNRKSFPIKGRPQIKASFPLEGTIYGGSALRSKVPKKPRKKQLMARKKAFIARKSRKHIKQKNHHKRHRLSRSAEQNLTTKKRSINTDLLSVPRKNSKFFIHNTLPVVSGSKELTRTTNSKANIRGVSVSSEHAELHRTENSEHIHSFRAPINKKTTTQGFQHTAYLDSQPVADTNHGGTDWADIHPIQSYTTQSSRRKENMENSLPNKFASVTDAVPEKVVEQPHVTETQELHPEPIQTERGKLRRLVKELKDVLHQLHEINPTSQQLTDASRSGFEYNSSPAVTSLSQLEAVSKSDLLSAFANVGKPQPIKYVDIESYTQDVWEPGWKGLNGNLYSSNLQYKRGSLPSRAKHRSSKQKNN